MKKSIAMGAMALALPVLLVGSIGVSGAWAKKAPVTVNGTLKCTTLKGTISFNPPLISSGASTGTEVTTVKVSVSGCSGPTGETIPKKGSTSEVLNNDTGNSCTGLASPGTSAENFSTKWSPATIAATNISFPGYTPETSPTVGFSLGGSKTTGTGSYVGTDAGKSSTATAYTSDTESDFVKACDGKKGIKKLSITSGTVNLQ